MQGPSTEQLVGWSSDGRELVFVSDLRGPVGLWAQAVANGESKGEPRLIRPEFRGQILRLTSSGRLFQLVDMADRAIQVATVDFTTGEARTVSPPILSPWPVVTSPAWAPDGKALAYLSSSPALESYPVISIQSVADRQVRSLPRDSETSTSAARSSSGNQPGRG